jgi:predicted  nucleic acid-binding Zn-ribbon protein
MELETEKTQRELELKRAAFQESEFEFALQQKQATIDELEVAREELEGNLAAFENERRQLQEAIAQAERKVRQMGNGGSSTEMDNYIAELEDQLNKLRKEKTQMEAMGGSNQKVEELEAQLREATTKITLLQGQVDEAEARATADQETILDELNIAAEKEAELSSKAKELEDELRKSKTGVQQQQAESIHAKKQIALLEATIQAFKTSGGMLPEQLDDAVNRVQSLLDEMAKEHTAQIKEIELSHHANTVGLQQQVAAMLSEKQTAERKVKEQEAQFNLNQTKTISDNKALKQQLEGSQEENKRLKQKLLFMSSQTVGRPSLLNLGQEGGMQVRNLETEMQKNQSRLDAATRQLAAEVSKNQIAQKRIEQQAQRLHDLEEQVSKMVKEHTKLAQEAGDGKKAQAELEELHKVTEQMKVEIEQLKLHPRSKIFRPLRAGGVLGAFRERIDFTTIALKSTGSKFLEDARAEAERAELLSKELR